MMTNGKRDPLDDALADLRRGVEPGRDLWPEIEAKIRAEDSQSVPAPVRDRAKLWKLAASVLLIVGAAITTSLLIDRNASRQAPQVVRENAPAPPLTVHPASFGSEQLGAQYTSARAELDRLFEERLATLAPETRDKLRGSLADMRRATLEISNILAEHPSDPLLQQLLLSAYQNELKLLADVTEMMSPSPRVDL